MNRRSEIERWRTYLEAEAAGRDAAADEALAALFRDLPAAAPRAGFSSRVMARIGRRQSLFAYRSVRIGLAAALAFSALAATLFGPALAALAGLVGAGGAVSLLAELIGGLSLRVAAGLALWSDASSVGALLARVALHPPVLALILVQFLIAAGALWGLVALAVRQRSSRHAAL